MMKIFKRIKKKIIHDLATMIMVEIESEKKKKSQRKFNSIKNKEKDSFFWGTDIYVSDPDKVQIGTNVHIGNNAYLKTEGGLKIGDNTHISRNLVLYTVNHNYKADIIPYNNEMIYKEVIIGKNVWIGMNVCIAPGTVIGDGCIIGMGTVVSGIVPSLSIIGSEKWKILSERDEKHYEEVVKKGRFGKENGLLYLKPEATILLKLGDRIIKNRSSIELIEFNNILAIKKTFEKTEEGKNCFNNEIKRYQLFEKYDWIPNLYHIGEDYIIIEYFNNELRLDQFIKNVTNSKEKSIILSKILFCLLDIFENRIAHCDFHAKNIFITSNGIKIIDFESSQELENNTDFFESYDIIGKGLISPLKTGNMCVNSEEEISLKKIFKINDLQSIIKIFNEFLIEELYSISNTFFTRKENIDKRHTLQNRLIYSTFDLKHLKVSEIIGQRNIKKRFEQFNINNKIINGKKVLDIGSNIGGILFEIYKMNPQSALGIEYDLEKVQISNKIKSLHNFGTKLNFIQKDVESIDFINNFNETYEVVFCLAVIEHLKDKINFIKKLGQICTEILYFEGNAGTNIDFIINELKKVGFVNIELIGMSKDEKNNNNNNRPLFIAKKQF